MKKIKMKDVLENYYYLYDCRAGACAIDGYGLFRGDQTLDENEDIPSTATPISTCTTVDEYGAATLELDGGNSGEHHGDLLLAWVEEDSLAATPSWTIIGKVHVGNLLPHEHLSIQFAPLTDCVADSKEYAKSYADTISVNLVGYTDEQISATKEWAEGKFAPITPAEE